MFRFIIISISINCFVSFFVHRFLAFSTRTSEKRTFKFYKLSDFYASLNGKKREKIQPEHFLSGKSKIVRSKVSDNWQKNKIINEIGVFFAFLTHSAAAANKLVIFTHSALNQISRFCENEGEKSFCLGRRSRKLRTNLDKFIYSRAKRFSRQMSLKYQ